jgi:hypothetical protein
MTLGGLLAFEEPRKLNVPKEEVKAGKPSMALLPYERRDEMESWRFGWTIVPVAVAGPPLVRLVE